MSGVFIAGLTTLVGSRDELEIVVDRRRGGPAPDRPSIERRHGSNVVRALERDGFALVPRPAPLAADEPARPIERAYPDEAYEHRIDRLLRFKHRRMVRLRRWLMVSAVVNAILVLILLVPAMKVLLRPARAAAPASSVVPLVPPTPAGRPLAPPSTRESQESRP